MSSNLITQPYRIILDPTGGGGRAKPVSNGLYYVGVRGLDPIANPRTDLAYQDEAGTERALTSPLVLNSSGAFVVSKSDGTLIQPYMKNGLGYSVLIQNKNGETVHSAMNIGDAGNITEIVSSTNLIPNSDFSIAGSVANPPDATPRSYSPDDELFSGFKAVGSLSGVTYVNGKLNGTGQLYVDVYKTEKQKLSTASYVASIASSDGMPVESGASFVDSGDYWRVTFDMSDTFSVKFERGGVATRHDAGIFRNEKISSLLDLRKISINSTSHFIFIDGFSHSGDGGECVWVKKGFDSAKAGNPLDLTSMEVYDASGNVYEPYGVYGTQKLEIKPNAVGAVGDFLDGTGRDNTAELEALRDYLISKGGGEIILDRFNVYGVSRCFKMGTSRNTLVNYQGDLTSGFGKLDGFTSSPATGATLDSVVRMNSKDFTDTVGTFEGWQCSSFIVQGMDGSVDNVTCMSVVGAVRGSTIDNILTLGGYDGLALTSCFSHIFTRNKSENAHRKAHVMGSGEYGVINDVVVNASVYQGNTGRGAGEWGLHWLFGSANGCSGNTYELNDKNAWFQDLKNGAISNLYVEGTQNSTDKIELKIGGTASEGGIVQNTSFDGVIAAFGGGKVVLSGVQDCEIKNFRLDPSIPITSDGGTRVINNKLLNAPHDSTIDKSRNETDTFTKGVTNSSVKLARFKGENRTIIEYAVGTDVPNGVNSVILSGFKSVGGRVYGYNSTNDTESFIDEIDAIAFGDVAATEKKKRGTPPTRSYSISGDTLKLYISSDYEIYVAANGVLFT